MNIKIVLLILVVIIIIAVFTAYTLIPKKKAIGEIVEFKTKDGWKIVGEYLKPPKENSPVLILLHRYGRDRSDWYSVAKYWHEKGFTILMIDLRGHGDSIHKDSTTMYYTNFREEDFNNMVLDVSAAINFLKNREVNTSRVFLIGESIGANLALRYASQDKSIKGIVLLSPGFTYHVKINENMVIEYGNRAILLVASKGDIEAYTSCQKIYSLAKGNKEFIVESGSAHGTTMFGVDKSLKDKIINFIESNL